MRPGSRAVAGTTWPRLLTFAAVAAVIVVADQVSKAWVNASFGVAYTAGSAPAAALVPPTPVLGDYVRIAKGYNNGAIFSLFGQTASFFAVASLVAIAAILWYEVTRGRRASWLLTLALGLLMGGAIGNEIDRIRLGYVIDWVDMGVGTWRWYTFNVADAAISVSIVVLLLIGVCGDPFAPREAGAGGEEAAGHDAAGRDIERRPG